jgi:hypothetical protein
MEFEKNTPVSDEQRRLAETKKMTLQPVHSDITPEAISDSEIANRHINGQPISNVSTDIEQDAPTLRSINTETDISSHSTRKQSIGIMIITIISAGVAIAISLFIALRFV